MGCSRGQVLNLKYNYIILQCLTKFAKGLTSVLEAQLNRLFQNTSRRDHWQARKNG